MFGTANTAADRRPIGSFYQYSSQHGVRRLAMPAVAQACSMAVSVDGKRLYFADGAHGAIMECRYDAAAARVGDIRPSPAGLAAEKAGEALFADGAQSS